MRSAAQAECLVERRAGAAGRACHKFGRFPPPSMGPGTCATVGPSPRYRPAGGHVPEDQSEVSGLAAIMPQIAQSTS